MDDGRVTASRSLAPDRSAGRHGAVKIGYLQPELFEMSADWMLALTPGGVDQDLLRLGHRHLGGPVYPFQPLMDPPALVPELIA